MICVEYDDAEIFSENVIECSGYPKALNPQPLFLSLSHTHLIPALLLWFSNIEMTISQDKREEV